MQRIALVAVATMLGVTMAGAGETASPGDAKVYFVNLKNGDIVKSPVTIQFGLSGMGIAPAGVNAPDTGHHHLVIDDAITGDALNEAIPLDDRHLHFGKGQTEATVALPKGTHTLQLVLGDWSHVPHNHPVMSERITIIVR
jgi:Domain of unknown function (DUF4399)